MKYKRYTEEEFIKAVKENVTTVSGETPGRR
jgi:hypothetical protein